MAVIKGTKGKDHLTSGAGADLLRGLKGSDVIVANGDDTLNGGRGNDTYQVFEGGAYVIVDERGTDTIETEESDVLLVAGIENLKIYQGGDWFLSTAVGNNLANTITVIGDGYSRIDGGRGKDTLKGGDGSDTVIGGAAADNMHGGEGDDVLVIDSKDWHVDGDGGSDTLCVLPKYFDLTRMPHERIEEFEVIDLSYSGARNALTVDKEALRWLSFNTDEVEVILGDGDTLDIKGKHTDFGEGTDGIHRYTMGSVRLAVHGSAVEGTSGEDVLKGNEWSNVIKGLDGADTLTGGPGNDTLDGGLDSDILRGGGGNDLLTWRGADDFLVSGDRGEDTLECDGDLDLTALANDLIQDVEIIECHFVALTLNADDILDLSSTTDTLKVLGNSRSSVDIVGAFVDEGVHDGFHRYSVGTANLLVEAAITDVS